MGVVVVLVGALAGAVNGWPDNSSSSSPADDDKPRATTDLSSHSQQGAVRAAVAMATRYGSDEMYRPADRHQLLRDTTEQSRVPDLLRATDDQYGPFSQRLGLDSEGHPPAGARLTSVSVPAGTKVRSYTGRIAEIDVWYSSLFGLTGPGLPEQIPVESGWGTMTLYLQWTADGWRAIEYKQTSGPTPGTAPAAQFDQVPQP
ncbi:hypothetical protein [Streptomyces sp. PsTaAH-124]|uniref:hypothetical protein n=1 Tax=Streptomyces sp. PsTaAH-124 TaxID=1157638 RepID=UPI00037BCC2A|nr:hypothetical protein [Streptomyces sp. PsTaAH-124]